MTPRPIQPESLAFGARSLAGSSAIHALVLGCLAWVAVPDLPGPVGGEVRARRGRPLRIEFALAAPSEQPFEEIALEEEFVPQETESSESATFEPEDVAVNHPEWDDFDGYEEESSPRSRIALKPAPLFAAHLEVPRTMVFASLAEPVEVAEELPEELAVEVAEPAAPSEELAAASAEEVAPTEAEDEAHESETPPAATAGEADVLPTILRAPAPHYPTRAIRLGQEGAVTCLIVVDAKGAVVRVTVAESSGYRLLDDAALEAVRGWRFEPGRLAGVPAERELRHIVRFELTL